MKQRDLFKSVVSQTLKLKDTPDMLVGIEFWRIRGKSFHVQPMVPLNEPFGFFASMGFPSIPQENDVSPEMPKQGAQKSHDVFRADIMVGIKPDMQIRLVSFRRNADCRYSRNFFPISCAMAQDRRLAFGCPSPAYQRQHGKAALVEENQVGFKLLCFFLCAASPRQSRSGLPSRPVRKHVFRVSAVSTLKTAKNGSCERSGIESRNVSGSTRLFGGRSKDRFQNRWLLRPPKATGPVLSFALASYGVWDAGGAWRSMHPFRPAQIAESNAEPTGWCSSKCRLSRLFRTPFDAIRLRSIGVLGGRMRFLEVS